MIEPRRPQRRSIVPSRRLVAELTNDEIRLWLDAQDAIAVLTAIASARHALATLAIPSDDRTA